MFLIFCTKHNSLSGESPLFCRVSKIQERRNNLLGSVLATNANTWHLALFDVVSGHVCSPVWFWLGPGTVDASWDETMAGAEPFLQVSPRRLANYAHGGKYSARHVAETAFHCRFRWPNFAASCQAAPGGRLNLLPSGISFGVAPRKWRRSVCRGRRTTKKRAKIGKKYESSAGTATAATDRLTFLAKISGQDETNASCHFGQNLGSRRDFFVF